MTNILSTPLDHRIDDMSEALNQRIDFMSTALNQRVDDMRMHAENMRQLMENESRRVEQLTDIRLTRLEKLVAERNRAPAPQPVVTGGMAVRLRWAKKDERVRVSVFTAPSKAAAFTQVGELVFSEAEWPTFVTTLTGGASMVELIEEPIVAPESGS